MNKFTFKSVGKYLVISVLRDPYITNIRFLENIGTIRILGEKLLCE